MSSLGKKQSDRPPQTYDAPPGEVEKVVQIKLLCCMAGMSAVNIAQLKDEFNKYERDRYDELLLEATNLARDITDVFCRGAALHLLIKLLMAAGDEIQAKKLFSVIEVETIQDAVLKDFPRLGAKFGLAGFVPR
jgi:hypothetical protein